MARSLALLTAGLAAVAVAVAPVASAQTTGVDCTKNHFTAGGYPATHVVPAGHVAIPTPGGIFPWERGGYDVGQRQGAANAVSLLDAFAASCPAAEIHLTGHSYGAGIVATAAETIDARPYAGRVHVSLTGNPRRVGGIEDSIRGPVFPGITFRGAARVPVNVASYTDVCNPRDGICNLPPLLRNPVGFFNGIIGYFTGAHRY